MCIIKYAFVFYFYIEVLQNNIIFVKKESGF